MPINYTFSFVDSEFLILCDMSLFLDNDQKIEKNCKIQIETNAILLMAYSLTNGNWIVQLLKEPSFTVLCTDD